MLDREQMVVYEFYDRPILYTYVEDGLYYLAMLEDFDYGVEVFLTVGMSPERHTALLNNEIDLHDAFTRSENGYVARITTENVGGGEKTTYSAVPVGELTPDSLPLPGAYLKGAA